MRSCHNQLDPLGFGLENFDAIGAWRDKDGGVADRRLGHAPVGRVVPGPGELKAILKARTREFTRCLTEKMLTYALGRGLEEYDSCAVDQIVKSLEAEPVPVLGAGAGDRQERSIPETARLSDRRGDQEGRSSMKRSVGLSRRTVLRGLGTAIALPWLEAMAPAAALAGGRRGAGRRPGGWRSSTFPTASTWRTGRPRRPVRASDCRRRSSRSSRSRTTCSC